MASAKFSIEGSPFSDAGFDVGPESLTVSLQLESGLDVRTCVYQVIATSLGAPALTWPSGPGASFAPDPPSAAVPVTLPAGAHWYAIRCTVNDGQPQVLNGGQLDYSDTAKTRILGVRTPITGLRKILVVETAEYDPTRLWTSAQNQMVDALEGAAAPAGARLVPRNMSSLPQIDPPTDLTRLAVPDSLLIGFGAEEAVEDRTVYLPLAEECSGSMITVIEAYGAGQLRTIAQPGNTLLGIPTGDHYVEPNGAATYICLHPQVADAWWVMHQYIP